VATGSRRGQLALPRIGPLAIAALAGVAAYVCAGGGLFFLGGQWQVPLFVGFVVGLVLLEPRQGAAVSLLCVVVGMMISPPWALPHTQPGVAEYFIAAVLAAAAGAAPGFARARLSGRSRQWFTLAVSVALVAWVLVNLWIPLLSGGWPPRAFGPIEGRAIREVPALGSYTADSAMYMRVFYRMHQGEPYYSAFVESWRGMSVAYPLPNTPTGYRLPTWFWVWRLLPSDAFTVVYLYLAMASVAVVAAAFIAGQLVGPRLAPVASVALAAYALGVGYGPGLFYVDMPAMSIALVGVAVFLWAARSRRIELLWVAAGLMTLAALTREILIYLPVLAALSALLEPKGERWRRAIPWVAGLAVFSAGYAVHAVAVGPLLQAGIGGTRYTNGGLAYVIDGFSRFSGQFKGYGWTVFVLVALGLLGAVASRRRASIAFAVFAAAAIALPFLAWFWIGNTGRDDVGQVFNYWGILVVPLALALWPACALLLAPRPDGRRRS
jgi:hypothetical protein